MSAIYQRARPINWEQVVGQEHVKDVLRSALEAGRVGHAYLFSGPRGVGKTTTARLIAMTANCQAPGKKPCGECESCLSVRAGSHPDVLEIDAASNNSVDDVRDLREKVGLSAMRGGKKIYILDEAHMMSRAAFNALLKTLEEPPEHVIFILATTEPEKIIPTILSRCQHYRFRRLTAAEIAGKLAGLVTEEGAQAEPEALNLMGRLADGAMRDGESLLERMLAAGQMITRSGVEAALGLPPSERVRQMAAALVNLDAGTLLEGAAQLYRDGYAARTVVEGLVSALSEALHAELGLEGEKLEGAEVPRLLRLQAALDAQEARFSRGADQLSLELALTHALIAGEGSGSNSPAPRQTQNGVASSAAGLSAADAARLSKLEQEVRALKAQKIDSSIRETIPPPTNNEIIHDKERKSTNLQETPARNVSKSRPTWAEILEVIVKKGGQQYRAFLREGRFEDQGNKILLIFDRADAKGKPLNKFHGDGVIRNFDEISKIIQEMMGGVSVEVVSFGERKVKFLTNNLASPPTVDKVVTEEKFANIVNNLSVDDIPDFAPTGRRNAPASARSATATLPPPEQAVEQPAVEQAAPDGMDLPDFEPSARPPRPTPARPDPVRPAPLPITPLPASPDDAAPAPLPERRPQAQRHAADPVAAPGQRPIPPPTNHERELYIPLEVSQEPDWDDLGGPVELSATPPGTPQQRATPPPAAQTPAVQAPAPPNRAAPAKAANGPAGDVRAHPNYLEVTRLFSGRVKEIGKVKKRAVAEAEDGAPEEEVADDVDGAAQA
ncbi:DNA polymerase III subunit gamma/tau [Deinococcus psychrotolerans]|uniref:DNA polymerase III subunit gamma/tau n=1 Tax=Deinococcus psychrotolerans TaxID=2489213 RepID=A0A3G8YFF3_9DEIO|nr:DNA polymerase III subunit gamma/tau [Deinococcus psychrotolerans]AZI43600.1 DNA polymerase III subunit gamma/tau [Deinococcus psychrotolerans]